MLLRNVIHLTPAKFNLLLTYALISC